MTYTVMASESKEARDNYIQFYKEDNQIWISIGSMEERGFTLEEATKILVNLSECIAE